jgi:hypothetical protein
MKTRIRAVCVIAILAMPSASYAQDRNTPQSRDFKMFLESISVRRNARVCERGIADYGKTFSALYSRWSEKHREGLSRGESILSEVSKTYDFKKYPFTNEAALARAKDSLTELADPPRTTSPIKLDARTTAACEQVLASLKN